MKNNIKPENKRLLDAFYYIDESVLSDVLADVRVPDTAPETSKRRALARSLRSAVLIAACALLLGAVFPVVSNLIAYFGEGTETNPPAGTLPLDQLPDYSEYAEYILTEEDVYSINNAFGEYASGKLFSEVHENLMARTKGYYYFGKYGDTIVIWLPSVFQMVTNFNVGGYSLEFPTGNLWFVNDSEKYQSVNNLGLLSDSQIGALYNCYLNEFKKMYDGDLQYTYPMFAPDLEYLSQKTMARINEDYYAWKYRELYEEYFRGVEPSEIPEVDPVASAYAFKQLGDDKYRFFNPKKCDLYQYYGKFGDCVVLAVENAFYVLQTISVADYTFELGGTGGLYVWRDGEIMHIGEALENGYLTEADIGKAHERYFAYQEYIEGEHFSLSTFMIPIYTPPEHTTEPVYWEFMPGSLTREEMLDIRRAYAKYVYLETYTRVYEDCIMSDMSVKDAKNVAFADAKAEGDKAFERFFRDDYLSERCYGKIGNAVVLAVVDPNRGKYHYPLADTSIEFESATELLFYNDHQIYDYYSYLQYLTTEEQLTVMTRHATYEARLEIHTAD